MVGIYEFTERLLVDKLWQGEQRTAQVANGNRMRRLEEENDIEESDPKESETEISNSDDD